LTFPTSNRTVTHGTEVEPGTREPKPPDFRTSRLRTREGDSSGIHAPRRFTARTSRKIPLLCLKNLILLICFPYFQDSYVGANRTSSGQYSQTSQQPATDMMNKHDSIKQFKLVSGNWNTRPLFAYVSRLGKK
jgi:hypothetical protein